MWVVIGVILFTLYCIGKFMEGYYAAQGGRKEVSVKHECYGEKYCAICGKKLKRPRN